METLLEDESHRDGSPDSLYRVLILMTKTYTKTLLKDKSPPDVPSDNLYWVFTLRLRHLQRLS